MYKYAVSRNNALNLARIITEKNDTKYALNGRDDFVKCFNAADDRARIDQWGNPLQIEVGGNGFVIISWGRDGKPGGLRFNQDIEIVWSKETQEFTIHAYEINP